MIHAAKKQRGWADLAVPQSGALNLVTITDASARQTMVNARIGGGFACSRCGHPKFYLYGTGHYSCQACRCRHLVTTGTWLHAAKASPRQVVVAALLFCGARKGISSLEMARALGMQPCAVYKMMMRFRNAIYAESQSVRLQGVVEVDGAFFGGHVRHENAVRGGRKYRYSRRNATNRKVVVVLKQRLGRTLTFVGKREMEATNFIRERIDPAAVIQADQSHAWDGLEALYETMRINHRFAFSSNAACTNNAEAFFASLRRMAMGTHHHISGKYLHLYAAEMAWRNDHATLTEDQKVRTLLGLLLSPRPNNLADDYWKPGQRQPPGAPILMEAA